MSEPQFLALGKGAMTISAHQGGREVSPGTGLGKRVSDGVTLILVLGFELLQPSRLPSHGADEETETQTIERSCLEATGAEPKYTDPQSGALFSPLYPLSSLLCGSGFADFNSLWLQACAGDGQPPWGGPWGPPKIPPVASGQGGRALSLPAALAFLASQEEEGSNLSTCPLWGPGTGAWPSATCLSGVWIGGT